MGDKEKIIIEIPEHTNISNADVNKELARIARDIDEIAKNYASVINSQAIETTKIVNNIFKDMYSTRLKIPKEVLATFESLQSSIDDAKKYYPEAVKMSKAITDRRWILPAEYILGSELKSLRIFSEGDINRNFMEYYNQDNNSKVFLALEYLQEYLPESRKGIIKQITSVLENDINDFKVIIPWLFIILDFAFSYEYVGFSGDEHEYMKESTVKKYKNFKNENNSNIVFHLYRYMNVEALKLLKILLNSKGFGKKQRFSRHFILHGRYNPDDISFEDFLKLVNLCSVYVLFVEFDNEEMA